MQKIIKHIFDYLFAIIIGVIAIPVLLIAMLFVKICSPEAPVLFKQERIGYKEKPFIIYKLRTMTEERDENGERLPDEIRLKKWGKILRKLNIDELTQILNIFAGQMSFIGPRPILAKEMKVMTPAEQTLRQSVMPGITGWEAIHEDETDNREDMAKYDLWYVEHWSLWLDVKIFFQTVFIVLLGKRPDDSLRAPKLEEEKSKESAK